MHYMSLNDIRNWIARQPASPRIKHARLHIFDLWRYQEEYEKIYNFVNELGGKAYYE